MTENSKIMMTFQEAITRAFAIAMTEVKENVFKNFAHDNIPVNSSTIETVDRILTNLETQILPCVSGLATRTIKDCFSHIEYPEIGHTSSTCVVDNDSLKEAIKIANNCDIVISDDATLNTVYEKVIDRAIFSLTPLQLAELFECTYTGKFANVMFAQYMLKSKWWKGYYAAEYWLSQLGAIYSICKDSSYARIMELVSIVIVMTEITYSSFETFSNTYCRGFNHDELVDGLYNWCFVNYDSSKSVQDWKREKSITVLDAVGRMSVKIEG
jgi:hypothetical protein